MTDDKEQSYQILKQTIPLLLKHQIPAVPTNYALWYTYASNQSEELNQALDKLMEQNSTITPSRALELQRQYLADQQEVDTWSLRQSLEAMLIELSQSLHDTKTDTQHFRQAIDTSLSELDKVEKEGWSIEETMALVRSLVKETQLFKRTTQEFTAALTSAEKEITELRQQLKASQSQALYDGLTGVYNRRCLDEELEVMEPEQGVCLIMVDLDHFKSINDRFGHQMGDRVLKAVAKRLKEVCGERATVYRFGGEEFSVLMKGVKLPQALHLAEVMRRNIEKVSVIDRRTNQTLDGISASFGAAIFEQGMRRSDLLEQADKQLYQAKKLGRNRVMPIAPR
ncbi:diguanylate cyclase [Aliiglaciecola sp. CAU 1673]|uniref:diguanylate cyclase n=1 Tax=Aliiglaciecola sp. CAU 1673 TaxID=3032595 RepID=UPI0023D9EF73|nr:diguanylate cyclase [Aliiglaciecola sp. CAU 1673]MDF2178559.1 diguanylate cyclase [Aliiglaciecola sp. CAU 1673]